MTQSAENVVLRPDAAALANSMRDIGYSLETAIADLIDNSITAGATEVRIRTRWSDGDPSLAVIDDGRGMDREALIEAMRHGTGGPTRERLSSDLGRFGLGMKTASLSQCRSLTVVSSQQGMMFGARWDLDLIEKTSDWTLSMLPPDAIRDLPFVGELPDTGTLVLWQKLDRLSTQAPTPAVISEHLESAEKHLSLVFHRYLEGQVSTGLKVFINNNPVAPFNPFLTSYRATQRLPVESVTIQGSVVKLTPYILPHHSKLSKVDQAHYGNRSEFVSAQGAYVYRNGRLMAWGDWFRVVPKAESTKLARVMIEFDNSQDELWSIDIKKSRARPPQLVREKLRQIVPSIRSASGRVYGGYAQKTMGLQSEPVWERIVSDVGTRYQINRAHVLVAHLAAALPEAEAGLLGALLDSVERAMPVDMIYADYSFTNSDETIPPEDEDVMLADLRLIKERLFSEIEWGSPVIQETVEAIWPGRFPESVLEKLIYRLDAA